jgi:hypothetical protein
MIPLSCNGREMFSILNSMECVEVPCDKCFGTSSTLTPLALNWLGFKRICGNVSPKSVL